MESLATYSAKIGVDNLTLTKIGNGLTIDLEKTMTSQLYSTKIAGDAIPEISGRLFPTCEALFQGFITALEKTDQSTKLTISPDAKLTFCHKAMVGKVELPLTFSISLD